MKLTTANMHYHITANREKLKCKISSKAEIDLVRRTHKIMHDHFQGNCDCETEEHGEFYITDISDGGTNKEIRDQYKIAKEKAKYDIEWFLLAKSPLNHLVRARDRVMNASLSVYKQWLNETPMLGTERLTQEAIFRASKTTNRTDFHGELFVAAALQKQYLNSLKNGYRYD